MKKGFEDGLFNLRQLKRSSSIAYVCGLIKDKNDGIFLTDGQNQYHLYMTA